MGQIYRLGNQFYDKKGRLKSIDESPNNFDYDELIREFITTSPPNEKNKDNLIHKFFYKYSMENMEKSKCNDKIDLFIVGYLLRDDCEDNSSED